MRCLGIRLILEKVENFCEENYKILLEIIKDMNLKIYMDVRFFKFFFSRCYFN